jgi:ribosomal protein S18 acetylase RimI-like enzyme
MESKLIIRNYITEDKERVIEVWKACRLIVQGNDPVNDINLKIKFQPELFFVATCDDEIIGTVMTGYDGHRGYLNYLGIHPEYRNKGYGRTLVEYSVQKLKELGCPKVNIQIRNSNTGVAGFYLKLGFTDHEVKGMQMKL